MYIKFYDNDITTLIVLFIYICICLKAKLITSKNYRFYQSHKGYKLYFNHTVLSIKKKNLTCIEFIL